MEQLIHKTKKITIKEAQSTLGVLNFLTQPRTDTEGSLKQHAYSILTELKTKYEDKEKIRDHDAQEIINTLSTMFIEYTQNFLTPPP